MNRKNASILAMLIVAIAAAAGGWYLWQKRPSVKPEAGKAVVAKQLWTCSMHPFIIREAPGLCPVCGMELVPKTDSGAGSKAAGGAQEAALPAGVSISQNQRVMANVTTTVVASEPLARHVEATGVVQYDQTRQSKITAWIACRIDRLNVGTVGSVVSREKPLAEVYSPDLVATQQEYLLALRSREWLNKSGFAGVSENGEALVASARERLRLFGVKSAQIAELERSGRPLTRIPIYPEFSGVVIEKMVQQGQYVNAGEVLFTLADLSVVWVEIELYENEFRSIRAGQEVEIRSASFPGELFRGKVALVYPYLDPKTRTVRVRVALPNPGAKLKPEMFVNASISQSLGEGIALPVTAVMDTGKRQIVWVEVSPGSFEPRQVTVGPRIGDRVQIVSGLTAGDKVVTTGGYLIDSESQLNSAK
jgi:membrane fusion protein, copper/silver efflux system